MTGCHILYPHRTNSLITGCRPGISYFPVLYCKIKLNKTKIEYVYLLTNSHVNQFHTSGDKYTLRAGNKIPEVIYLKSTLCVDHWEAQRAKTFCHHPVIYVLIIPHIRNSPLE